MKNDTFYFNEKLSLKSNKKLSALALDRNFINYTYKVAELDTVDINTALAVILAQYKNNVLRLLDDAAKVREFGVKKYTYDSFKEYHISIFVHAFLRHYSKMILSNEVLCVDGESCLPHAAHAYVNLMFINLLDDDSIRNNKLLIV